MQDMQLTIGQVRRLGVGCRPVKDLVNGAQCDPRTHVKLTCKYSINGTDQLFPRTGFNPVT